MESTYTKAASTSDIAVGSMKTVKLGEKELLIANVNGSCYAIGNKCTHAGGDLSKGTLQGSIVECPKHHAKFDVTTGKVVSPPKMAFFHPKAQDVPSYQVNVQNEDVMVKL
jgi:3-phenylpropionate/trans-cinnamate dioxygenase ferredoxin subunit